MEVVTDWGEAAWMEVAEYANSRTNEKLNTRKGSSRSCCLFKADLLSERVDVPPNTDHCDGNEVILGVGRKRSNRAECG